MEDRHRVICQSRSQFNEFFGYFAVYDGHGGDACCDFCRTTLHRNIFEQDSFPSSVCFLRSSFILAHSRDMLLLA